MVCRRMYGKHTRMHTMIKNKTIKRSTYRLTLAHKVGEVHIWCQKESLFFHVNPNLCRLAMGSDWFINEEKIL